MIEYLRCIYLGWAASKPIDYVESNYEEYVQLASTLLHYTEHEVRSATKDQTWVIRAHHPL